MWEKCFLKIAAIDEEETSKRYQAEGAALYMYLGESTEWGHTKIHGWVWSWFTTKMGLICQWIGQWYIWSCIIANSNIK